MAEDVVSERLSKPSPGTRAATAVTFNDAGLSEIHGSTVQAALVSADASLGSTGAGIAAAVAAAAAASAAAVAAQAAADAALAAAGGAGGDASAALLLAQRVDRRDRVIDSSTVATTVANSTAKTTIALSDTNVAGFPSSVQDAPGDVLRFRAVGSLINSSGSPVTFRVRVELGSVLIADSGAVAQASDPDPVAWVLDVEMVVRQADEVKTLVAGRQGAPAAFGTMGPSALGPFDGVALSTGTDDLGDDVDLVVSVQMGTASASAAVTCEGWSTAMLKQAP